MAAAFLCQVKTVPLLSVLPICRSCMSCTTVRAALQAAAVEKLEQHRSRLPVSVAICSIALAEQGSGATVHGRGSRLIISRYVSGRPPLIVEVPAPSPSKTAPTSHDSEVLDKALESVALQ